MAKIDLERMTYADLSELRDRVDAAMIETQASEKKALKAKLEALAAESGFSIEELISGGKRSGRKGSSASVVVKYRNSKDPSQTWSGRGRKPNWLGEAVSSGKKIESFLV